MKKKKVVVAKTDAVTEAYRDMLKDLDPTLEELITEFPAPLWLNHPRNGEWYATTVCDGIQKSEKANNPYDAVKQLIAACGKPGV